MNRTAEEALRLDNQLCFPLYAASREVVKQYHPLLASLNLTYTQYLVMLVLWEKAYIIRTRSKEDERVVCVLLTDAGVALKNNAGDVPGQISASIPLTDEEAATLHELLYKILNNPEK